MCFPAFAMYQQMYPLMNTAWIRNPHSLKFQSLRLMDIDWMSMDVLLLPAGRNRGIFENK